jgi:uncharacterized protein YjbI with pentapeptide repeats
VTNRDAKPRAPRPPDLDEDALGPAPAVEPDLDIYQARLTGDHAGVVGRGEITGSLLDGANLAETRLDPLSLVDVRIRRGDLSNAVWAGVTARRVEITDCRTVGWRVILDLAEDLLVTGCRWDYGSLYIGRSRGALAFRDCSFAGTTVRGDLSKVTFDGCEFAGVEFDASAAKGCDLRTSRLTGARGLLSLRGARITLEQAVDIADLLATEAGLVLE